MEIKNKYLSSIIKRGYLYQSTNIKALESKFENNNITFYIGFDLTAKSLHVGSLLQIMLARRLLNYGCKLIVLFGGGTTKIGDPSGRDKTRQILSLEEISQNKNAIKNILNKFFKEEEIIYVDNKDWLNDLNYIDFLRDVGKYFSINQMLTYESVKTRLEREQSLTFIEFSYMILQAYDFTILAEKYGCNLQIGGSDQWGNIVNGIELYRKLHPNKKDLIGFTTELLVTSDGKKMGKTADGAVWLDEELLSPYEYYQFWRNISDDDVIKFLKLFTELDLSEINELSNLKGQELNQAKEILAYEATKICHGIDNAENAKNTSLKVFENGGFDNNLPEFDLLLSELEQGITFSSLISITNLVDSRSAAKRIIKGGGGKINNKCYNDPLMPITKDFFKDDNKIKISAGKKKHALIKLIA